MKRFIMFFVLILISIAAFCQPDSTAYPIPGSFMDIFADLKGWFASTATVAGLTIFLTAMVAKVWKTITAIMKQAVALVFAVLLIIGGSLANIGFMADYTIFQSVVYGLIVGFMANGWYDLKNIVK